MPVAKSRQVEQISVVKAAGGEYACPNVKEGGMAFGSHPDTAAEVISGESEYRTAGV